MVQTNLVKLETDLDKLIIKAEVLYLSLANELTPFTKDQLAKFGIVKLVDFKIEYETWYSEALLVIKQVLPDRVNDFTFLYKNEKRKEIDFLTYTISDYMLGLVTKLRSEVKVDGKAAFPKFEQQKNILIAAKQRFKSSLFDIKKVVQADIFDSELELANQLLKNGFLRAAGTMAGVVLEKHLNEVCHDHNFKVSKRNPTISDLNDLLKNNNAIDTSIWRMIQYLGDIRNLCCHNKEREPKKDEVEDLIEGVSKIIKTIF